MSAFYIAIFGALGCLSRYLVAGWAHALMGRGLPYGTLIVNLMGSFLLGLLMESALRTAWFTAEVRAGIAIGFMGGFTTFSTFSYETVRLLEEGSLLQAGVNILLNVTVCIFCAALGIYAARQLI